LAQLWFLRLAGIQAFKSSLSARLATINGPKSTPEARKAALLSFGSDIERITRDDNSIETRAVTLARTSVSELDAALKQTKREYNFVTILSYVLFVVGWLLGLIGQVFGGGAEAAPAA
jgi:hypothetical protein